MAQLPTGYQELDFIDFNTDQYINTQFIPDQDTKVEAKFRILSTGSYPFGTSTDLLKKSCFLGGTFSTWKVGFGDSEYSFGTVDTKIHQVEFSKSGLFFDNEKIRDISVGDFTSPGPFYIGKLNRNTTVPDTTNKTRIYSLNLYSNGVLEKEFIPAIKYEPAIRVQSKTDETYLYAYSNAILDPGTLLNYDKLIIEIRNMKPSAKNSGRMMIRYDGTTFANVSRRGRFEYTLTNSSMLSASTITLELYSNLATNTPKDYVDYDFSIIGVYGEEETVLYDSESYRDGDFESYQDKVDIEGNVSSQVAGLYERAADVFYENEGAGFLGTSEERFGFEREFYSIDNRNTVAIVEGFTRYPHAWNLDPYPAVESGINEETAYNIAYARFSQPLSPDYETLYVFEIEGIDIDVIMDLKGYEITFNQPLTTIPYSEFISTDLFNVNSIVIPKNTKFTYYQKYLSPKYGSIMAHFRPKNTEQNSVEKIKIQAHTSRIGKNGSTTTVPAYKFVENLSVNERIGNLIIPELVQEGYIGYDGIAVYTPFETYVSDFIEVIPGETYSFKNMGELFDATLGISGFEYDKDKKPIGGLQPALYGEDKEFSISKNAKYVRVHFLKDYLFAAEFKNIEEILPKTDFTQFSPLLLGEAQYANIQKLTVSIENQEYSYGHDRLIGLEIYLPEKSFFTTLTGKIVQNTSSKKFQMDLLNLTMVDSVKKIFRLDLEEAADITVTPRFLMLSLEGEKYFQYTNSSPENLTYTATGNIIQFTFSADGKSVFLIMNPALADMPFGDQDIYFSYTLKTPIITHDRFRGINKTNYPSKPTGIELVNAQYFADVRGRVLNKSSIGGDAICLIDSKSKKFIIQRILDFPSELTKMGYLENHGNEYIRTGITASSDTKIEIDFTLIDNNSEQYIMGAQEGSSSPAFAINGPGGGNQFVAKIGTYSRPEYNILRVQGHRYKISLDGSGDSPLFAVADLTSGTSDINAMTPSSKPVDSDTELCIFAFNESKIHKALRVHSARIWQGETIVREFVPAKRKADNTAGFYDRISKVFFTNSGSGEFTIGG